MRADSSAPFGRCRTVIFPLTDDDDDDDDDMESTADAGEDLGSSEESEGDKWQFDAQTTKILHYFKDCLESSNGGLKNSKAAKQHAT